MQTRTWAAAVLMALVTTGCARLDGGTDSDEPRGSNADSSQEGNGNLEQSEPESQEEAEAPPEEENPTFGDTYTWDNGLSVTIAEPQEFEPSSTAAFDQAPNYRSFEITVVNNTGAQVDLVTAYVTVQSGDQEMSEVFDSEQGYNGAPGTALLDGRQSRYKVAFGVQRPEDIVMQFDPGQYEPDLLEPVIFASIL